MSGPIWPVHADPQGSTRQTVSASGTKLALVIALGSSTTRIYLTDGIIIDLVSDLRTRLHPTLRLPMYLEAKVSDVLISAQSHLQHRPSSLSGTIRAIIVTHSGPPSPRLTAAYEASFRQLHWHERFKTVVTSQLQSILEAAPMKPTIVVSLGVTTGVAVKLSADFFAHRSNSIPGLMRGGAGYDIGLQALNLVFTALHRNTPLSPQLLSRLVSAQCPTLHDLLDWAEVLPTELRKPMIGSLAGLMCQAAEDGDESAQASLKHAASSVAGLVADALSEAHAAADTGGDIPQIPRDTPYTLLLLGGLIRSHESYRRLIIQTLEQEARLSFDSIQYEHVFLDHIAAFGRNKLSELEEA